ncbi:HBL156Wp [Eremothecium sinecaudum]|uniref:Exocyst complex component Sec8 n=1 Tax=Eremothecium sinecaudum TaxID=45286 RepID=A0A109UWA2_9SACH|nr:HBL156Wp [Eremothecium sinecaudum]AMD18746.1 HBL156Wp [Eremothecium sinecaudum]
MSTLKVPKGRSRGLSITSFTDGELNKMNDSLDNLRKDLSLIETSWNKIITKDANPLELALAFLDDTSVGLGHRYRDFHELKSQIANDLQEAVNEHYQAFNSSIASYGQTLKYFNGSRETLMEVQDTVKNTMETLTKSNSELEDLNNEALKHSLMIQIVAAIDEIIKIPEKVERLINEREFGAALSSLLEGFSLAKNHDLWGIPALHDTRQQLELQEHMLFETVFEEVSDLIYSKRRSFSSDISLLGETESAEGFNSLESYLYQVINSDINEQSKKMTRMLGEFKKKMGKVFDDNPNNLKLAVQGESDYDRVLILMSVINAMDKLPFALKRISERNLDELHQIVVTTVEGVRSKFPNILSMIQAMKARTEFGIPGKDYLSIVLRKLFWEIFTKFITAAQVHRIIYEIANKLQSSSTDVYSFGKIWSDVLSEINTLLQNYASDPTVQNDTHNSHITSSKTTKTSGKSLFSLQENLVDNSTTKKHTAELKNLLQDMFPGFVSNVNVDINDIMLQEANIEHDETLVPLSVFNMKVILASFLEFVQGTKDIIPVELQDTCTSSLAFFQTYMNDTFLPLLERTVNHFYDQQVESKNPYTLRTIDDNSVILKSAVDFRNLFIRLLHVMNTGYTYREGVASLLLTLLDRIYRYYCDLFQSLLNSANTQLNKKLVVTWLDDKELARLTEKIQHSDTTVIEAETESMLSYCPGYDTNRGVVTKNDYFNNVTIDTITYFLGTLTWICHWLPQLKQEVKQDDYTLDSNDFEKMRTNWSFFEAEDMENLDRLGSLKFLVTGESAAKFEEIMQGFEKLQFRLLGCLRFDVRARCIYSITELIHTSKWDPETTSIELNPYITSLTSEISMLENRLSQRNSELQRKITFIGLSSFINTVFINGSKSIKVINKNGIKKIIRNATILQQTCRNISSTPELEDMSLSLNYFTMCFLNENTLVEYENEGKLKHYTLDQLKNILRLQLSEEYYRKLKQKGNPQSDSIMSYKRYEDAVRRLSASA